MRHIPPDKRPEHSVTECMIPIEQVPRVDQARPLPKVLDRVAQEEQQRVLVADHGSVVGIVTPRDIARRLQRAEELDVDMSERGTGAEDA